ncbi:TM2 domain-containing protein [Cognatitamlana onchidii]|uniref:TM2 domain-containing protein n=1 Tax=Cognatitamlana onchidii TaxID=2562860 RepID=UPI0010A5FCE5|nr:TM2 domain-containing protein [Algibacter onchidii]
MSDDKNLKDDLNEKAKDFAEEAKETASEFAESAKETFGSTDNKKVIAGILGILFGGLGIHKFVLGYNKEGFILLIATILTCGFASIIGFIEGIIYLTRSDADFYNTYQAGKKPWF